MLCIMKYLNLLYLLNLLQQPRKRAQPASTSASTSTSTSRANKSKRQKEKDDDDDDQYTEKTVSAQATSRWKPIGKASKQFVLDTLDDAIMWVWTP